MRIALIVALGVMFALPAHARDLTQAEQQIISEAVGDQLKDPYSARYKWPPLLKEQQDGYCGWVNAKNSYGAYVGSVPFRTQLVWRDGQLVRAVNTAIGSVRVR